MYTGQSFPDASPEHVCLCIPIDACVRLSVGRYGQSSEPTGVTHAHDCPSLVRALFWSAADAAHLCIT